jgi:dihydrofolate reductase (trimethoprim resistance protein)
MAEAREIIARAWDRERAAQMGEPDPWKDEATGPEWDESLACADCAIEALTAGGFRILAPGQFAMGERVTKKSGSSWTGRIVGTYSTSLTPEGYAIESENEPGSVQIYPAAAIRRLGNGAAMSEATIDAMLDAACGVGNTQGLPVFTGRERELIELGIRRALARGCRVLAPGELDGPSLEAAAKLIDEGFDKQIGKPFRRDGVPSKNDLCVHGIVMYEDCESCAASAIRRLANPGKGGGDV